MRVFPAHANAIHQYRKNLRATIRFPNVFRTFHHNICIIIREQGIYFFLSAQSNALNFILFFNAFLGTFFLLLGNIFSKSVLNNLFRLQASNRDYKNIISKIKFWFENLKKILIVHCNADDIMILS